MGVKWNLRFRKHFEKENRDSGSEENVREMKEEGGKVCCKISSSTKNTFKLSSTKKKLNYVAELTLAPSGDEILPVRSQEL